jgi:hypothetical protein
MKKRKMAEKLPNIEICELFLVKADWNRTFMGQIIRETTAEGKEIIRGTVVINEGKAWSVGNSEEDLGNNLDDICTMKLDHNLHADPGVREVIAGDPFFLN